MTRFGMIPTSSVALLGIVLAVLPSHSRAGIPGKFVGKFTGKLLGRRVLNSISRRTTKVFTRTRFGEKVAVNGARFRAWHLGGRLEDRALIEGRYLKATKRIYKPKRGGYRDPGGRYREYVRFSTADGKLRTMALPTSARAPAGRVGVRTVSGGRKPRLRSGQGAGSQMRDMGEHRAFTRSRGGLPPSMTPAEQVRAVSVEAKAIAKRTGTRVQGYDDIIGVNGQGAAIGRTELHGSLPPSFVGLVY